MPGETTPQPVAPTEVVKPAFSWAARAMGRGEDLARHLLSRLRPRMSLASGSVLVLLTLFLPIGYNSCGPETRGFELLQGQGDWPTFLGITLSEYFAPAFYGAVLLLAAGTALFTVISLGKPARLQNRVWNHRMFVASGILSLFLFTDVLALLPMASDEYGAVGGLLIAISCLLPGKFWPKKIFWRWFGVLAISASILAGSAALNLLQGDTPMWLLMGIAAIYALVPLGLWWAQVSGRKNFGAMWNDIRRGLVAFYLPALLGNLWFLSVAWGEGVWGFVPCWFGIHLMAIGYMRLAKEGDLPPAANKPPDGS